MKTIGLTGGIGSGKSTVARMFEDLGVHAVDADTVAREVVEPGTNALSEIAAHFGTDILQGDGSLDRGALRRRIFENQEERHWLESLLHPIIREEIQRQLWLTPDSEPPADYQAGYVLLVSPLLLETDQYQLVDQVIVVDVPESVQIERTMARDSNTEEEVRRIIATQASRETRREHADFIIDNSQPLNQVQSDIEKTHELIQQSTDDF